jgi:hypothetical protein
VARRAVAKVELLAGRNRFRRRSDRVLELPGVGIALRHRQASPARENENDNGSKEV